MVATVVGLRGTLTGKRFTIGGQPITFGRGNENDVVIASLLASRVHAELRPEAGGYVLQDRGSSNGTWVNGKPVITHQLQPGDEILIGDEIFRFETPDEQGGMQATAIQAETPDERGSMQATAIQAETPDERGSMQATAIQAETPDERGSMQATPVQPGGRHAPPAPVPVLRVTVTGGGPVGLSFALLLEHLMGPRVAIKVYDGRWLRDNGQVVWKTADEGNVRRQQVVTIQSRQYLKLPPEVQERLFIPGVYTEMWPKGPDSIQDLGPRNIRIAYVEDQLLAVANDRPDHIQLIPERFDPAAAQGDVAGQHVLAICEGSRSGTLEHFAGQFGAGDSSLYALDGKQVQDMVLGLRVKSELPDPMAVLLTVAQNRFLLNSLHGEGFLNMRLTDQEANEAVGIDLVRRVFTECIQAQPCLMELRAGREFYCAEHNGLFLPALMRGSPFWARIQEGLELFGIPPENLTAVTGFRLDMVQRPRFTAQLYPKTSTAPGTFGFLLGDAANAIHFWPGRGLNSGLASVISLARCLASAWRGTALRDADFLRHEAVMAMLQYRHKSRAWRQMVMTDTAGNVQAIKDQIALGIAEGEQGAYAREADINALMERLGQIRSRLERRIDGLPDDATLRVHLERLPGQTLHTLLVSEAWDTGNVGGEEVDVEWLLEATAAPEPA